MAYRKIIPGAEESTAVPLKGTEPDKEIRTADRGQIVWRRSH
jgi:hypothetical protein